MLKKHPFKLAIYKKNPTELIADKVTEYDKINNSNIPLISIEKENEYIYLVGDVYRVVKDDNVSYQLIGFYKVTDVSYFGSYELSYKLDIINKKNRLFHSDDFTFDFFDKFKNTTKVTYLGNIFLHEELVKENLLHLIDIQIDDLSSDNHFNFNDYIDNHQSDINIYWSERFYKLSFSPKDTELLKMKLLFKKTYLKDDWTMPTLLNGNFVNLSDEIVSDYKVEYEMNEIKYGQIFQLKTNKANDNKVSEKIHYATSINQKNIFNMKFFTVLLTNENKQIILDLSDNLPKELDFEYNTLLYSLTNHYETINENSEEYTNQILKLL